MFYQKVLTCDPTALLASDLFQLKQAYVEAYEELRRVEERDQVIEVASRIASGCVRDCLINNFPPQDLVKMSVEFARNIIEDVNK